MDQCINLLKGASVEDIDAQEETIEDLEGKQTFIKCNAVHNIFRILLPFKSVPLVLLSFKFFSDFLL